MPAHDIEVTEALEEGVTMRWLSTITRADEGRCRSRRCASTTPGSPSRPASFETLEADSLVLALGQDADLTVLADVPA